MTIRAGWGNNADWQRETARQFNQVGRGLAGQTPSIMGLGAVGDGVADDTAAFVAGLVDGAEIFLSPGTYLINPTVFTGLVSLKIRGAGRDVTKIKLASTGAALTFSNCQWLHISDLSIEASGVPQSLANAIGIQLDTGSCNSVIERVNFYGFSLGGMRQIGTLASTLSGNTVRDCNFLGNGGSQFYGKYSNDFKFVDNQFGQLSGIAHATNGCYLEDCGEGTYQGNFHWNNSVGFRVLNGVGNRYLGNRIEESDLQGVYLDGGYDCQFSDNTIHTNSQTTDGASDNFYATSVLRMVFNGNKVRTWNAKYSRWGVNFDTGCDDIIYGKNQIRGYDVTNFGPVRFTGTIARFSTDVVKTGTATAAAAGATVYLSNGTATTEGAAYIPIHCRMTVLGLYVGTSAAPGAAQTYTYTVRKNGVDTAMTVASSGAASFAARVTNSAPSIVLDAGDFVSIKLVTSAGAAVADHRFYLLLAEY